MTNASPTASPRPRVWVPLDLAYVERKPKTVLRDEEFILAITLSEREKRDYAAIVGLIQVGGDLEPYYRRSDVADRLLKTHQVIHLHLGGPGSNAILYAVQYPTHVLLVRVDNHVHLDDLPPGKRLPTRGRAKFQARLKAETQHRDDELAASKARLLGKSKLKPAP